MAFPSYPYAVEDFIDQIYAKWTQGAPDVVRFDENSTQGGGNNIPTELAVPKWMITVGFADLTTDEMLFLETRVRKLNGEANALMVYDPRRKYPKYDPDGSKLAGFAVVVSAVGTDNQSISLTGLPAGFQINIGDKGQMSYGTDSNYFFEFSDNATADGSGATSSVQIWPHVPISITASTPVNLIKPAFKATVQTFNVGTSSGPFASGVSLDLMEHI